MTLRLRWRAAALALVLYALAAQAHVVYGTKTLWGFVSEADLVVRARIVAVHDRLAVGEGKAGPRRPSVEADVLEVLKGGDSQQPRLHFVQHGHGVATFESGDETLLFLLDIERSRELVALGQSGAYAWVSLQEHQDEYALADDTRESVLAAVRIYAAAGRADSPELRAGLLRRATLQLLTSGDPRLASSALRDLVAAPTAPLVTGEDLAILEPVLADPGTSMGVRVALIAELERRRLIEGHTHWLRLLSAEVPPRDRITALRAAGQHSSAPVRAQLAALLADPNPDVAAAAADALGSTRRPDSVPQLTAALGHDSEKVRMAAIRGLGRISTPEARRALAEAAASHPDPATQRRARAEVRLLDGRRPPAP